jgi:hypothetical protein
MTSIDRAIRGIVAIVLWLTTVGGFVAYQCAMKGVSPLDFGVKEVCLALGGGLVGFLTGVVVGKVGAAAPQTPEVE